MPIDLKNNLANTRATVMALGNTNLIAFSEKPFTLRSGDESIVYVNGRNDITEDAAVLRMVGELIAREAIRQFGQNERRKIIFMGAPAAGQPLAVSASLSSVGGPPKGYRTLRDTLKTYGSHQSYVDGAADPNHEVYVFVDNVITDGQTKRDYTEKLRVSNYPVEDIQHIVLVDRQQGAIDKLTHEGYRISAVFNLLDLVQAYGKLGIWPTEQVRAVEEEIARLKLPA